MLDSSIRAGEEKSSFKDNLQFTGFSQGVGFICFQ